MGRGKWSYWYSGENQRTKNNHFIAVTILKDEDYRQENQNIYAKLNQKKIFTSDNYLKAYEVIKKHWGIQRKKMKQQDRSLFA